MQVFRRMAPVHHKTIYGKLKTPEQRWEGLVKRKNKKEIEGEKDEEDRKKQRRYEEKKSRKKRKEEKGKSRKRAELHENV